MNYRKPVWVDTDISINHKYSSKEYKDVDDSLALISLINSKTIEIKGISSTFANTDSKHSYKAAKKIVKKFSSSKIKVYEGAKKPISKRKIQNSDASKAIAKALEKESLRILSLGSATNIATVIIQYPHLVEQIEVYKGVVPISLGADALGGAINVITPALDQDLLDISYTYGSFNTQTASVFAQTILDNDFSTGLCIS